MQQKSSWTVPLKVNIYVSPHWYMNIYSQAPFLPLLFPTFTNVLLFYYLIFLYRFFALLYLSHFFLFPCLFFMFFLPSSKALAFIPRSSGEGGGCYGVVQCSFCRTRPLWYGSGSINLIRSRSLLFLRGNVTKTEFLYILIGFSLSVTHQEPNRRHTLVNFPFSKFFVLIRGRSGSENTSEWIWIRENETNLNKQCYIVLCISQTIM